MLRFGVPINQMKSVCSNGQTIEFAKRTSFNNKDVSGLSWKMFVNEDTFAGRVSHVSYFKNKIENSNFLLSTVLVSKIYDKRGSVDSLSILAVLTSFIKSKQLDLSIVLKILDNYSSLVIKRMNVELVSFPIELGKKLISFVIKKLPLDEFIKSHTIQFARKETFLRITVIKRIRALLDKGSIFTNFVENNIKLHMEALSAKNEMSVYSTLYSMFQRTILTFDIYKTIDLENTDFDGLIRIEEKLLGMIKNLELHKIKLDKIKVFQ
jgi:hypothetical protein